jgi:hypothetical protein
MIDFRTLRVGDKLRIVGVGAPGFARLGDIVTVESCNGTNRCDVVHDGTGARVYFALTCGAARLEPANIETDREELTRVLGACLVAWLVGRLISDKLP